MNPHTRRHRQRRRDTRARITKLACLPEMAGRYRGCIQLPNPVTWQSSMGDVLIWGASRIPADRIRARRWPWAIERNPLTEEAKSQLAALLHPHLAGPILKPRHPTYEEFYERRLEP